MLKGVVKGDARVVTPSSGFIQTPTPYIACRQDHSRGHSRGHSKGHLCHIKGHRGGCAEGPWRRAAMVMRCPGSLTVPCAWHARMLACSDAFLGPI